MITKTSPSADVPPPSGRAAGVAIALASGLSVAFMAYHPRLHAKGMAEFVEKAAEVAVENAIVHGSLVAALGVLVAGFGCLTARLGGSLASRAGLVAYSGGAIALATAALVSGFIVPELVSRYHGSPRDELETVRHVLGLCRAVNQVCSKAGVMGTAAAMLLWSVLLVRRSGFSFAVGVAGCVCGAALVAGLLSGHLKMDIHGMVAFAVAQAAWNAGVSTQLIRKRL